jgi:hypothetical protein
MLIVAFHVQADSPTRSNTFWATKPFHPSAMLAAKLFFFLMTIVGAGVAAEWIALSSFNVPSGDLPLYLARAAVRYALLLLACLVIAAFTSDIRSFILLSLSAILAYMTAAISAERVDPLVWSTVRVLIVVVAVGGGATLLLHLYRTRDPRRRIRAAAVPVVVASFAAMPLSSPVARVWDREAPAALQSGHLTVRLTETPPSIPARQVSLKFELTGASARHRVILSDPWLTLVLRDGTTLRLPLFGNGNAWRLLPLSEPDPELNRPLRWIRPPAITGQSIQVDLENEQRRAVVAAGISSATLEGRLGLLEPRMLGELPLARGASFRRDGYRVRIHGLNEPEDDPFLELDVSFVSADLPTTGSYSTSGTLFSGNVAGVSYGLVNAPRGEALWFSHGGGGGGSSPLLLPGVTGTRGSAELNPPPRYPVGDQPMPDRRWYDAARLIVVEWVPVGTYSVRVTVDVP